MYINSAIEMKYRSTRGKVCSSSFEDVLFSGYTSDGGMFMPEHIPVLDKATLEKWKELSYLELTKEVMSLFIPPEEISVAELNGKGYSRVSQSTKKVENQK